MKITSVGAAGGEVTGSDRSMRTKRASILLNGKKIAVRARPTCSTGSARSHPSNPA